MMLSHRYWSFAELTHDRRIRPLENDRGAAPRVNMSIVRGYPIPLPPLAEQHRIVAKVDELMALCEQLEANLSSFEDTRRRLLNTLLYKAFEPTTDCMATA